LASEGCSWCCGDKGTFWHEPVGEAGARVVLEGEGGELRSLRCDLRLRPLKCSLSPRPESWWSYRIEEALDNRFSSESWNAESRLWSRSSADASDCPEATNPESRLSSSSHLYDQSENTRALPSSPWLTELLLLACRDIFTGDKRCKFAKSLGAASGKAC